MLSPFTVIERFGVLGDINGPEDVGTHWETNGSWTINESEAVTHEDKTIWCLGDLHINDNASLNLTGVQLFCYGDIFINYTGALHLSDTSAIHSFGNVSVNGVFSLSTSNVFFNSSTVDQRMVVHAGAHFNGTDDSNITVAPGGRSNVTFESGSHGFLDSLNISLLGSKEQGNMSGFRLDSSYVTINNTLFNLNYNGLIIDGASPRLTNCTVINSRFSGIRIFNDSNPTIVDSNISDNQGSGLTTHSSQVHISYCEFSQNRGIGIVLNDSVLQMANSSVTNNTDGGVLFGSGSSGNVVDSYFSNPLFTGITCTGSSSPTIERCNISYNDYGFQATGHSSPTLLDVTFYQNNAKGLICNDFSNMLIVDCDISSTLNGPGVWISHNSSPTVTGTTIMNNVVAGVEVRTFSSSVFSDCIISGNRDGLITKEWSHVTLTDCTIVENLASGISLGDNGEMDATSCTINNNGIGAKIVDADVSLTDCSIDESDVLGISVESSDLQINGGSISNNQGMGIDVNRSGLTSVQNVDIQGNGGHGIKGFFSNLYIFGNRLGENDGYGVISIGGEITDLLNNYSVPGPNTAGQVIQVWEVGVRATDDLGNFLPEFILNVTDANDITELFIIGGVDVFIPLYLMEYRVGSDGNEVRGSPYVFKSSQDDFGLNTTVTDVEQNLNLTFVLSSIEIGLGGDLENSFEVSDDLPSPGDTINITATVSNKGSGNASNIEILFRVADWGAPGLENITTIEKIGIPYLESGQSTDISTKWVATLGVHELFLVIDPNDNITEIDETNNNISITIRVFHPPVAVLRASTNETETYVPVMFNGNMSIVNQTDAISPFIEWYIFDFGDGNVSNWMRIPRVNHTYTRIGIYNATLRVVDSETRMSHLSVPFKLVVKNSIPVIDMDVVPISGDITTTFNFSGTLYDVDGWLVNYTIDFGDGTYGNVTFNESNILSQRGNLSTYHPVNISFEHRYSDDSPLPYKVVLNVWDNLGGNSSYLIWINISNLLPQLSVIFDTQGPIRVGQPVIFDASGTTDPDDPIEALTFSWFIYEDNISEADLIEGFWGHPWILNYSFDREGDFIVVVTVVDDDNATVEWNKSLTVLPLEEPPVNGNGNGNGGGDGNDSSVMLLVISLIAVIILAIIVILLLLKVRAMKGKQQEDLVHATTSGRMDFVILNRPGGSNKFIKFEMYRTSDESGKVMGIEWRSGRDGSWAVNKTYLEIHEEVVRYLNNLLDRYVGKGWVIDYWGNGTLVSMGKRKEREASNGETEAKPGEPEVKVETPELITDSPKLSSTDLLDELPGPRKQLPP